MKRSWIKRTSKTPYAKAKKKAWDAFSRYIRLRDCLKTMFRPDVGRCITCNLAYEFKRLQAGHLVQGRGGAVLFDEMGVNAQCYTCNITHKGKPLIYRKEMVRRHGEEVTEQLEQKYHQTRKRSVNDFILLEQYYKDKYEDLMNSL